MTREERLKAIQESVRAGLADPNVELLHNMVTQSADIIVGKNAALRGAAAAIDDLKAIIARMKAALPDGHELKEET